MLISDDANPSSTVQSKLADEASDERRANALKGLTGRASNTPRWARSAPGKPPVEETRPSPLTRRSSLYAKNSSLAPGIGDDWDDEDELSPPDEAFLSWVGLCVDVQGHPLRFLLVRVRVFGGTPAAVVGRK